MFFILRDKTVPFRVYCLNVVSISMMRVKVITAKQFLPVLNDAV